MQGTSAFQCIHEMFDLPRTIHSLLQLYKQGSYGSKLGINIVHSINCTYYLISQPYFITDTQYLSGLCLCISLNNKELIGITREQFYRGVYC